MTKHLRLIGIGAALWLVALCATVANAQIGGSGTRTGHVEIGDRYHGTLISSFSSAPTTSLAGAGAIYYNSTDGNYYKSTGTAWALLIGSGSFHLNGDTLFVDADEDTWIEGATDDQIDIAVGGQDPAVSISNASSLVELRVNSPAAPGEGRVLFHNAGTFEYMFRHDVGATNDFALRSTNVDGIGTDGDIFSNTLGTDDVTFSGQIGIGAAPGTVLDIDVTGDADVRVESNQRAVLFLNSDENADGASDDAYIAFNTNAGGIWRMGLDDSDGDALVVSSGASLGTTNVLRFTQTSPYNISLPNDNQKLLVGSGSDIEVYHNGTNSIIDNNTGALLFTNSSGNEVLRLDSGDEVKNLRDSGGFTTGAGSDFNIHHNGTNSNIENSTGNLNIKGSSTGNVDILVKAGAEYAARMATDGAVTLYYDNTGVVATNANGVLFTGAPTTGNQIALNTADASDTGVLQVSGGGAAGTTRGAYLNLYGNEHAGVAAHAQIIAGNDGSGEVQLIAGAGSAGLTVRQALDVDVSNGSFLNQADNEGLYTGAGNDLRLYHDATNSHITNQTARLFISTPTDIFLRPKSGTEEGIIINDDGAVDLYYDNSRKFLTSSTGFNAAVDQDFGIGIGIDEHDLSATSLPAVTIAGSEAPLIEISDTTNTIANDGRIGQIWFLAGSAHNKVAAVEALAAGTAEDGASLRILTYDVGGGVNTHEFCGDSLGVGATCGNDQFTVNNGATWSGFTAGDGVVNNSSSPDLKEGIVEVSQATEALVVAALLDSSRSYTYRFKQTATTDSSALAKAAADTLVIAERTLRLVEALRRERAWVDTVDSTVSPERRDTSYVARTDTVAVVDTVQRVENLRRVVDAIDTVVTARDTIAISDTAFVVVDSVTVDTVVTGHDSLGAVVAVRLDTTWGTAGDTLHVLKRSTRIVEQGVAVPDTTRDTLEVVGGGIRVDVTAGTRFIPSLDTVVTVQPREVDYITETKPGVVLRAEADSIKAAVRARVMARYNAAVAKAQTHAASMAGLDRVGPMADEFQAVTRLLAPGRVDSNRVIGDVYREAMRIALRVQARQIAELTARVDSLAALHSR